jgi:hypothetical protein
MRARNKIIGALGAALGIVVAVTTAISPASARPAPDGTTTTTLSASSTCATFEGLTVYAPSVSYASVALRAGETITAWVSPATSSDTILVNATVGFNFELYGGIASQGFAFTAKTDRVSPLSWQYTLPGSVTSTLSRTWTFDCSSTTVAAPVQPPATAADDDHDGVANSADVCSGTVLPDSVSRKAAGSYYANASGSFIDGTGRAANVTVTATKGCSAVQIAKALGLSKTQSRSGISLTTLNNWVAGH